MRQYLHVYIHLKHDLFGCQSGIFPQHGRAIEIKANRTQIIQRSKAYGYAKYRQTGRPMCVRENWIAVHVCTILNIHGLQSFNFHAVKKKNLIRTEVWREGYIPILTLNKHDHCLSEWSDEKTERSNRGSTQCIESAMSRNCNLMW